jgi:hypothetical protein
MNKKNRFGILDWLTAVACGIISFCYISDLDHNSKIVGPFINSVFELVSHIVGEHVAGVLILLISFGLGFLLGCIFMWFLKKLTEKYERLG